MSSLHREWERPDGAALGVGPVPNVVGAGHRRVDRLERLVVAFACLLLLPVGAFCCHTMSRAQWSSASSGATRHASFFFIGRTMIQRVHALRCRIQRLLHELLAKILQKNWG